MIDGRSDIYSLAAVTYEMLTGEPPHMGNTAQAIIARLLTDRPRPIRATRSAVPEHVDETLAHALEKLPADRFGTAHEFAASLEGRSPTSGTRAAAAAPAARAPTWKSRLSDPLVLALGAAVIASLALAGTVARRGGRPPRHCARCASSCSRGTACIPAATFPWPAAISPDGGTIVFSADPAAAGPNALRAAHGSARSAADPGHRGRASSRSSRRMGSGWNSRSRARRRRCGWMAARR